MLTPQEVSEHAFAKASFGGYNMSMVDDFLDQVTEDYTALYKENASLKAKMKVLADSLEEYRATEKGMRRALLAAQQAADEMLKDAESRKSELLREAEADAAEKIAELHRKVADEEARLAAAQAATSTFVDEVRAACRKQEEALNALPEFTTPIAVTEDTVDLAVHDIEDSVLKLLEQQNTEEAPAVEETPEEASVPSRRDQERDLPFEAPAETMDSDLTPTRRIDFDNLQFGSNYDLK